MNSQIDNKRLQELAGKWKDGSITAAEQAEFNQWYDSFDDTLLDEVSDQSVQQLKNRLYSNVLDRENIGAQPVKTFRLWSRIAVAAAIVIIIPVGLYVYSHFRAEKQLNSANYARHDDVKPGGNKATLTLVDGTSIVLSDATNGKLAEQSGVSITKTKNGQLVYQFTDSKNGSKSVGAQFNTVSTPKGGQYQITLPDGTSVWLNAASSLKFPVTFSSLKERKVELNGEAYFEVFKDKHKPFKVASARQEVEVLGTHFNISTYKNEANSKTTLLEGSVKLHTENSADVILKPGEQSVLKVGNVVVHKVNADEVIAWKNGNFLFNDESLVSIMKQLERWYDVQVDYSTIPDTHYNGFISRNVNLSKVLRHLEVTGNLKFKIEGKVIKVYK